MRWSRTARIVTAFIIGGAACRGGGQPAPAELATPVVPCAAQVPDADLSGWREVRASGFTFCVPGNWTGRGQRWQLRGSRIDWTTAERVVRAEPVTAAGRIPAAIIEAGGGLPSPDRFTTTESIGGRLANLVRDKVSGKFQTSAEWLEPRINFDGEAGDLPSAELQLTIYRTVRFIPPP